MSEVLNNLNHILNKYDIFILDQCGVMHDCVNGFDHAINTIEYLFKKKN